FVNMTPKSSRAALYIGKRPPGGPVPPRHAPAAARGRSPDARPNMQHTAGASATTRGRPGRVTAAAHPPSGIGDGRRATDDARHPAAATSDLAAAERAANAQVREGPDGNGAIRSKHSGTLRPTRAVRTPNPPSADVRSSDDEGPRHRAP